MSEMKKHTKQVIYRLSEEAFQKLRKEEKGKAKEKRKDIPI